MGEENNRSSVENMEAGNSPPEEEEEGGDNQGEEFEKNDEQRRVGEDNNSDCVAGGASAGDGRESRASQSDTLTSVQVSESGFQPDSKESPELLSEVPVEYSLQPLQSVEELKDQVREVEKEPLKRITGQSAQVKIQISETPSNLKLLPMSVKQSISPTTLSDKKAQPVDNGNSPCLTEHDKLKSPGSKPVSVVPMLKTPDGYNWRKYGQKQVKSPEGSRSYYRCTFSDCYAKKIECCDRSNRVIETVYRSHHNHDPPQKGNCARETRHALAIVPFNGSDDTTHPVRGVNDPVPSTSSKEPLEVIDQIPEIKQQDSCGSDETIEVNIKGEYVDGPEYKRRQKRSSLGELSSISKTGKKPKYVVHAAGDVGISGDGYRWRKYGQKMVKGNPHPRNYYRCTSAGCPVRKHIERAVDNVSAVVITYKGVHDHDMPVPRKRHGPKSDPPVASTTPVSVDNSQTTKTESCQSQTQWSVDKEGELTCEALNPGGEKTSESARTLLSIGFEIKPC
ncbi:probable WRKY transcription factor 32 isoform X1 [Sesamum indicum]|uniref:Probable WRKY transcription factor 32 isoform X1 n=1 Tax=Sesamum indicum TaxID=4182 RepID=A0A6I9TGB1_SESIN|nr:probable WRKY transcription factor 32 isoform X1 [Sesamum indicum]